MECPQCDGSLEEYALEGSHAVHCPGCGYVGIDVDHRPEPRAERESWAEVVERFRRDG